MLGSDQVLLAIATATDAISLALISAE